MDADTANEHLRAVIALQAMALRVLVDVLDMLPYDSQVKVAEHMDAATLILGQTLEPSTETRH